MTQPMTGPVCDCGQAATHQAARDATDEEAAAWRQSMNEWRASKGFEPWPADSAAMAHPVTVATYHCCDHKPDGHAPCPACPGATIFPGVS